MTEKQEEKKEFNMLMIDVSKPPPGYEEAVQKGPPFIFKNVQPNQQGPRPWRQPPAPGMVPMPDQRIGVGGFHQQYGPRPGQSFRGRGGQGGRGQGGRGIGRGFRGGGFRGFRGRPKPKPMGHGAPKDG